MSRNYLTMRPLDASAEDTSLTLFTPTHLAEQKALEDNLRGLLTHQAMVNLSFLAEVEDRYAFKYPLAKDDFRLLVKTYAVRAAIEIMGGDE